MKNVIVFSLAGSRFALELRWVREVVTLGWVTPVPSAPLAVAGVFNYHGAIVPVVDLTCLTAGAVRAIAHAGEGAIVIQIEDVYTALRTSGVDEVATLALDGHGGLVDSRAHPVALVDPPTLVAALRAGRAAAP